MRMKWLSLRLLSLSFFVFIIGCSLHQSTGQTTSTSTYIIDTLVVMDDKLLSRWTAREPVTLTPAQRSNNAMTKLKQYLSLVIRQANIKLESLNENQSWAVQLSVAGFVKANPLTPTLSGKVDVNKALTELSLWVSVNYPHSWNDYDYILCMTGHDLEATTHSASYDYDIKGIAYIRDLCLRNGTSLAIVEDQGGFQSPHFVAHELGHSLGAVHDGTGAASGCPNDAGYIMSTFATALTPSTQMNRWKFSTCSTQSITNNLKQLILPQNPDCLQKTKPADPAYTATQDMVPGQVLNVNDQCQFLEGRNSRLCLGYDFGQLEDVCSSMSCLDTTHTDQGLKCKPYNAAEGTSCGQGKWCEKGKCVHNAAAPTNIPDNPNCLYGDSPVTINGQFSCQQFVAQSPWTCYNASIQSACCQSCQDTMRDSKVCPYGDKLGGCRESFCEKIDVDGTRFEEICCGTCGYDVARKCEDVPSRDGMTCEELLRKDQMQRCYDPTVAYHCCDSCRQLRLSVAGSTSEAGCEYGDHDLTCSRLITDQRKCDDESYQRDCCLTCARGEENSGSGPRPAAWTTCLLLWLSVSVSIWLVKTGEGW